MEKDERIFYNANDGTYGYLRDAEKDANQELSLVKEILGDDYVTDYLIMNIGKKALGLSYSHYYEDLVDERINSYIQMAKNLAIRYIRDGRQEDYDKAKELLDKYDQLQKLRVPRFEGLWSCVDDNVYEVITNENGERIYKILDLDAFFSEAK